MLKRFVRHKPEDAGSSGSLNDLSFLLIIFFIVIAGFNVNKGFLMSLPSKEKPRVVNTSEIIKCNLDKDGNLFTDGKIVSEVELEKIIKEKAGENPQMTFLLSISPQAPYQFVVNVISMIRQLKVENFSFKMEEGV
ncbi:biopolymer transporter ExbD [Treponema sp.]|uniref:ExbD/TolR family protein n=1 Tax=Treponema sp. TaxID=166 RepID=UPI0025D82691|nr:biopolymer transporter ExbD [Treponema sp.]MCR5217983.1 biopolymer transporter ExbD [Treponema sp.]